MPSFCRHNRLIQNCPICSREQAVELRPLVSSSAPRTSQPRPAGGERPAGSGRGAGEARGSTRSGGAGRVVVKRLERGAEDGYSSPLLPGLRSSEDARRLAHELAFAATRLRRLEQDPPGLYTEVADPSGDPEERAWLAFQIAYLCPAESEDPFQAIRSARTPWASGKAPEPGELPLGPRTAHDPSRGTQTLNAYRVWAARAGSQETALRGDAGWSAERRFARVYERLALPGLHRAARFDLLVTLGAVGVAEMAAGSLALGGTDPVTLAAKRILGIGDTILLERRASDLATGCGLPLAALDLALWNFERGERATVGLGAGARAEPELDEQVLAALGV